MPLALARLIVGALGAYGLLGALFAAAFVTRGVERVDRRASGTSWGFRLLIAPGAAALWPYLLRRWIAAARGER